MARTLFSDLSGMDVFFQYEKENREQNLALRSNMRGGLSSYTREHSLGDLPGTISTVEHSNPSPLRPYYCHMNFYEDMSG